MGFFNRKSDGAAVPLEKPSPQSSTPEGLTPAASLHANDATIPNDDAFKQLPVTWLALVLGAVASIGGFMFGYESGQISGTCLQHILLTATNSL